MLPMPKKNGTILKIKVDLKFFVFIAKTNIITYKPVANEIHAKILLFNVFTP